MKKNIVMRIASALLVVVLLTACAISGTFAKYTTTASGSSSARVAKWGFGTSSITFDMFDGEYTNVKSGDGTDVVAPGTEKTTTVALVPSDAAANTEVAYTFDANITITGDATLLSKLEWKLNDGTFGTIAALQTAIDDLLDGDYAAGTAPTSNISITWQWPFDGDDTSDTQLGSDGTATIDVTIDFTATQKD